MSSIRLDGATCCDGTAAWCAECGGRRWRYLAGVAFVVGSNWAHEVERWHRERGRALPAEWPGRDAKALEKMAITADGRPRLQAWLAVKCQQAARERWAELVAENRRG